MSFKGDNKKKNKKKFIVTQSWYDTIERFFQFHTLLFLEMDANHKFGQNPLSGYSNIVIFMFCTIFSNSSHLGIKLQKKSNGFIQEQFWPKKLDQFQPMGLEILSFSCLCYFFFFF